MPFNFQAYIFRRVRVYFSTRPSLLFSILVPWVSPFPFFVCFARVLGCFFSFLVPQIFYFTGLSFVCKCGLLSVLALNIICLRGLIVGPTCLFCSGLTVGSANFIFRGLTGGPTCLFYCGLTVGPTNFIFRGLTEGPTCLFYCGLTVGPTNFIFRGLTVRPACLICCGLGLVYFISRVIILRVNGFFHLIIM